MIKYVIINRINEKLDYKQAISAMIITKVSLTHLNLLAYY